MSKPAILVARAIFPEVIEQPAAALRGRAQPGRRRPGAATQLIARLQGKAGAFTTGSERIDAALLAACPQLKICANMAVGYNNFDLRGHDGARRCWAPTRPTC